MGSRQVALRAHHFELPLRHAFGISRSTHTVQTSVIVELDDGVHQGYGEATTNPYYGVSLESLTGGIEKVREFIQSFSWDHPAELWEALMGCWRMKVSSNARWIKRPTIYGASKIIYPPTECWELSCIHFLIRASRLVSTICM